MVCATCAIDAITTATATPNTAIIVRVAVRIVKEVRDAVRAVGSLIARSSRWIFTTEAATFCYAPLVTSRRTLRACTRSSCRVFSRRTIKARCARIARRIFSSKTDNARISTKFNPIGRRSGTASKAACAKGNWCISACGAFYTLGKVSCILPDAAART